MLLDDILVEVAVEEVHVEIEETMVNYDVIMNLHPEAVLVMTGNVGPKGDKGETGDGILPADTVIPANTRIVSNELASAHTEPAFRFFGDGKIEWGPGGDTPPDVALYRETVGKMVLRGKENEKTYLTVEEKWPYISMIAPVGFTGGASGAGISFWGNGVWVSPYTWDLYTSPSQAGLHFYTGEIGADVARLTKDFLALYGNMQLQFGDAQDANLYRYAERAIGLDGYLVTTMGAYTEAAAPNEFALAAWTNGDPKDRFDIQVNGTMRWGDGTNPLDVSLYRLQAGVLKVDAQLFLTGTPTAAALRLDAKPGANAFAAGYEGEAQRRLMVGGDGKIEWGDGFNARDTYLLRSSPGTLRTPGVFEIFRNAASDVAFQMGFGTGYRFYMQTDGRMTWGPGTAWDTSLYRSAAECLRTDTDFAVGRVLTALWFYQAQGNFFMNSSGKLEWGPGDWSRDVDLYRRDGNGLETSRAFSAKGSIVVGRAAGNDNTPLYFGSALDTSLNRDSAGVLKVNSSLIVPGSLVIQGEILGTGRLGEVAKSITDWNNALQNGYYMGAGAANQPVADGQWYIGEVFVHNSDWITQRAWQFTAGPGSPIWERRKNNGTWSSWTNISGGGATQIVTHTNQLVASPGARALVRVAVAQGQYENIGLVYDSTTGKWEADSVYFSDSIQYDVNTVGWWRAGYGRRFPWMQFHNAGLKPQVRATCQAQDISNDQNGAEIRVMAIGDAVYRGSGIQYLEGQTQVAYDGRYGISYGGWCSMDTGWGDVNTYVTPNNCLVFNPQVATNDGNGHNASFRGIQLMLRWTAI